MQKYWASIQEALLELLLGFIVFSWIFKKRYSGYSGYSKKLPIPRDYLLHQRFFTKIKSLEKKLMVKKHLKNLLCSNCDLWSLQNRHSRKQQNLIYLSYKEKSTSLVLLKIPFYVRYTNTKNANSKVFFFEKVSFSNCDPSWSFQNQHAWKQQNMSYLSHKEKKALYLRSWKYLFT